MSDDLKHLEALVTEMKESLTRQIREFAQEMREGIDRLEEVVAAVGGKTRFTTVKLGEHLGPDRTDWARLRAMSEEDIQRGIASDPDNPEMTREDGD